MHSLFRFCASVKLAVLVMLALCLIMAGGTFYEATFGSEAALARVYGHWTFLAVMAILAINVLAAAVIRFPWKKHQTGFVITHLGILILLFGGLLSYRQGVDGFIQLTEGMTASSFSLRTERLGVTLTPQPNPADPATPEDATNDAPFFEPEPVSAVLDLDFWKAASYPNLWQFITGKNKPAAPFQPISWTPQFSGESNQLSITLNDWLVAARAEASYEATPPDAFTGGPAVQLGAQLSTPTPEALEQEGGAWIHDASLTGIIQRIGDTEISLARTGYASEIQQFLSPEPANPNTSSGEIILRFGAAEHRLQVDDAVGKPVSLPMGWTAIISDFAPSARLVLPTTSAPATSADKPTIVRLPPRTGRPIVVLSLRQNQDQLTYWLDPLHPHVIVRHDNTDPTTSRVVTGPSVRYHHPAAWSAPRAPKLLHLLQGPDKQLHVRFMDPKTGLLPSDAHPFRVLQHLPSAKQTTRWVPASVSAAQMADAQRLVRLSISSPSQSQSPPITVDVARGQPPVTVQLPDSTTAATATFSYGFAAASLPFAVTLIEARQTLDPASSTPADFFARVRVSRPPLSDFTEHTITLNHPLTVKGYTLYHSKLDEPTEAAPNIPRVLSLAVRKDPGTPVKYAGGLIMCLGIAMMFYMRAYKATGKITPPSSPPSPPPPTSISAPSSAAAIALILFSFLLGLFHSPPAQAKVMAQGTDQSIAELPVMLDGRIKPLDSLARLKLLSLSGKSSIPAEGFASPPSPTQKLSARTWLISAELNPSEWDSRPLLYVPRISTRKALGLEGTAQHIAPSVLRSMPDFLRKTAELSAARTLAQQRKEIWPASDDDQALLLLRERLNLWDDFRQGNTIELVRPDPTNSSAPITLPARSDPRYLPALQGDSSALAALMQDSLGPAVPTARIQREVLYNRLHPFALASLAYATVLLALLARLFAPVRFRGALTFLAALLFAISFLVHSAAFVMRCSITGWAPVTNLYESVVWVGLVCALVTGILWPIYRTLTPAVIGASLALLMGLVADVMPPDLGQPIRSLQPVLRSNIWLTVHVLPIVSSYAAFAVAMALGNVLLFQHAKLAQQAIRVTASRKFTTTIPSELSQAFERQKTSLIANTQLAYRAVQLGVLLVVAGTILGGLWADVSWGRFWGWDPKETWALIVCLAYLALIHARFAGWASSLGFAAGCVIAWMTVIMSWYGVNFLLGVGLHSYGFGTGGAEYVAIYLALQLIYLLIMVMLSKGKTAEGIDQALPSA